MTEDAPISHETAPRRAPLIWLALILLGLLGLGALYAGRGWLFANNAKYQLARGNLDLALARARQAHQFGLGEADYQALLVRIYAARQEPRQALAAADQLLRLRHPRPATVGAAALAVLELNDPGPWRRWLTLISTRTDVPAANAAVARGILLALGENWKPAAQLLANTSPDDPDWRYFAALWLGRIERESGQPVKALQPLAQAGQLRAKALAPRQEEARCYLAMGDTDEFRYRLDELRGEGADAQRLVEEMDGRLWCAAASTGKKEIGLPPRSQLLYEEETKLAPSPHPASDAVAQALAAHGDAASLIEMGRNLENAGRRDAAGEVYQLAIQSQPSLFFAQWLAQRLQKGADRTIAALASSARDLALKSGFTGEWFLPSQLRWQNDNARADLAGFAGAFYSEGRVQLTPRNPLPGRHTVVILAASSTVHDVGAWMEVSCRGATRRFYVNSLVPQCFQADFYFTGQPAPLSIAFVDDARDPKRHEDRNLFIYGVGAGDLK